MRKKPLFLGVAPGIYATGRTGFTLLHQLSVVLLYLREPDLAIKFLVVIITTVP